MKKIVMLTAAVFVMFFALSLSVSADTWKCYNENGDQINSPEGFPAPFFDLHIRPVNAWAGMSSEQGVKLIMDSYISEDVKGTLTLASDIIKDGSAAFSFEMEGRKAGSDSRRVEELVLKANVTSGEHEISAEVTFDVAPGSVFRSTLTLRAEEPETRYFMENETTEYFYGDKYTIYSENDDIATASGGIVRCLKPGSCYIIAKKIVDDPMEYNEYCTRLVISKDTRFDDEEENSLVNEPQVTNDGAVTILPIGYGTLDDGSGNCYAFDISNSSNKPIDVTVHGESSILQGGTFSHKYTIGKSGESDSLVNVKAKLTSDFVDQSMMSNGVLTEFTVVYNDGTDNRASKLSVTLCPQEHISASFEPGEKYPIETNYTWISSDPSIVSVEENEATAHTVGDVRLTGTSSDGGLLVYDITVGTSGEGSSGEEDDLTDGKRTIRLTYPGIIAAVAAFSILYAIMRKIILKVFKK